MKYKLLNADYDKNFEELFKLFKKLKLYFLLTIIYKNQNSKHCIVFTIKNF